MKKIVLALVLLSTLQLAAQDETVKKLQADADKTIKKEADTLQKVWRKGGIYSLNISQGSLNNWAAGGDDFSLSLNSMLTAYAFYKKGKSSWDNTIDFNIGLVNTTSLGSRKNDDRLDILSKYGYAIAPKWNIATLLNFRSQLFKGYTYTEDDVKTFSSNFLAPAYVLLSLGLDFKPTQNFSLFISPVTARWVIVKDDSLSAQGLYGVDSGKHVKPEFGAFLSANFIKQFSKTVAYKGRLDLFSNYLHNPEKIDLYMTNLIAIKLSKVLAATWNLDLIYDDDVKLFGKDGESPALQVKSLVGVGLLVRF